MDSTSEHGDTALEPEDPVEDPVLSGCTCPASPASQPTTDYSVFDISLVESFDTGTPPLTRSSGSHESAKRSLDALEDSTSISRSDSFNLPSAKRLRIIPSSELLRGLEGRIEGDESSSASKGRIADEDPYIIAYDKNISKCMKSRGLAIGTQWEIARLVSEGTINWDIDLEKLDKLRGSNAEAAPKVKDILRSCSSIRSATYNDAYAKEAAAKSPWEELDREDEAFRKNALSCLGITAGDWYGGQVQFPAKLIWTESTFKIVLEQPALGSSSRFTRRFGSDWLIRVRIHKDLNLASKIERLQMFLIRPFIVNGQVYRFFYANKERNLFLMATNEGCTDGVIRTYPKTSRRMSLLDFSEWHNSMHTNFTQTVAKWAARMALGLSNSVPGVLLNENEILDEPEIISPEFKGSGKVPSEMEMTDGCGFINTSGLMALYKRGFWAGIPTAVQCRIAGAKGLLLRHPSDVENGREHPTVWVRPSQTKIKYTPHSLVDPAKRIVDVLRASHMTTHVRLANETIINLAENGVQSTHFKLLLRASLTDIVDKLLDWDGENGMAELWNAVAKAGGVIPARAARQMSGTARVRGLRSHDVESDDSDDEGEAVVSSQPQSAAWWADTVSGCPSSLEETVLVFLDSGFLPSENPILAKKLHEVIKKSINSYCSKCRIIIPMACSAFIVPDPCGILEEGEIHVKSSSRDLIRPDGTTSDRVLGDVLVTRNPCKLPTDVQKVKAVFKAELDHYVDVIIFSTKGARHLASMLGTGDYDGDKVQCIWQPEIVDNFQNAAADFANPPTDLENSFLKENESVAAFLERVPESGPVSKRTHERQRVLMGPLRDLSVVGIYSSLHDNSIYQFGYGHPDTIRLAWMFCTVLDGSKTGMTVSAEVLKNDKKKFGSNREPAWKRHRLLGKKSKNKKGKGKDQFSEERELVHRCEALRSTKFIMDELTSDANKVRDEKLAFVEQYFDNLSAHMPLKDDDLERPWRMAQKRLEGLRNMMEDDLGHRLLQVVIRVIASLEFEAERAATLGNLIHEDVKRARTTETCLDRDIRESVRLAGIEMGAAALENLVDRILEQPMEVPGAAMEAELVERIQRPIEKLFEEFRKEQKDERFTGLAITTRQDFLRKYSLKFVGIANKPTTQLLFFSDNDVRLVRASYAYVHCPKSSRFPWNVAMRDLGEIKAKAKKDYKVCTGPFYDRFSIRSSRH